jgi:LysR family transcriptional regulator, transcriptional activator of nhaA
MELTDLNFRHLRVFTAVAATGSVVRAARALDVSQPTVSAQLHALEAALGQQLVERVGRGLVVTEVGRAVARYADEIFTLGRALESSLTTGVLERPTRFTIGVVDSLPKLTAYRLMAAALPLPVGTRLVVRVDKGERLFGELASHEVDLVLSDHPLPPSSPVRATAHPLGESPVVFFGTPALARRVRRRFPDALNDTPFLLPVEGSVLRRSVEAWFRTHNVRPRLIAEVEDLGLLQTMAQHGHGCFAAPAVVERSIRQQYGVEIAGRPRGLVERFWAVTAERRLRHPAAIAIARGLA